MSIVDDFPIIFFKLELDEKVVYGFPIIFHMALILKLRYLKPRDF